jgi:hypothetical protein
MSSSLLLNWRMNRLDKARNVWRGGLAGFPDADRLSVRLNTRDDRVASIVEHAIDADVRVDTTVRELFPDVRPFDELGSR